MYQLSMERGIEYEDKVKELVRLGIISKIQLVDFTGLKLEQLDDREVIILLSLKLGLNRNETNRILKELGYGGLYAKEIGDILWIYSINHSRNIMDVISNVMNSTGRRTKVENVDYN